MLAPPEQRAACDKHLFIPDLVPGEVIDAGDDIVTYRMIDGSSWSNDARNYGGRAMLTLRPYQEPAIASHLRYFQTHKGNPLVILPTAAGKSLVAAAFIEGVLKAWPDQRILIVTHVRELIAQNHAEMIRLWPDAPTGIYSAGLGKRDVRARILFAGIQSIHRRAQEIGHTDLVLIDEAHLIPGNSSTMYRRFLDGLTRINPALKVIGLTATPFRTLHCGMLHEGKAALFTDIAYEAPVCDLIDAGYLSPLVSKQPATRLDVSKVGTRAGDFIARDLAAAVDQEATTRAAVGEIIDTGKTANPGWLSVRASNIPAMSRRNSQRPGITCRTIFGDTPKDERDAIIAAFKRGEIRALASMGVLTTGFNAPAVDLIALLRPTQIGRALCPDGRSRHAPWHRARKTAWFWTLPAMCAATGRSIWCAPNAPARVAGARHQPRSARNATASSRSRPRMPGLRLRLPAREVKIAPTAATLPVLSPKTPQWLQVHGVSYSRHDKPGGRPSLKVTYHCGLKSYSEWVCIRASGLCPPEGADWWRKRAPGTPVPLSVDEAIAQASRLASQATSRSAHRAAILKSPVTGSIHAPTPPRPLRRLPPGTSRLWLVQPDIHRLGQAAGQKPQTPLLPHLPGHLPQEDRHDRSHPE